MNLLLPIGAISAYFLLKSKPKTKSSSASSASVKKDYISDDCQWYCPGALSTDISKGFDFSKELYKNKKIYCKFIDKYANEPDFGIQSLTKEVMKTWNWGKCKTVKSDISIDDPLTLRFAYVNELPTAAFYLALSGKMSDYQLALWLGTEYPKLLVDLGLLTTANYKEQELSSRFDAITPEILNSTLAKLFILIPEFRNIQAELIAQILLITLSQIIKVVPDSITFPKCFKITEFQYGDFSSLSGQIHPMYMNLFKKIFDAVVLAKQTT